MPEEGEFVICTVTKVQSHSVFAKLNDFGKSGMIHISEIAPGRIRNIRDYVAEGRIIVCKVLRINHEKGHIDLSLRRVGENQRREKINEMKQEQKAEKIIEHVAHNMGVNKDELFKKIQKPIFENYPNVYSCFADSVNNENLFKEIGFPDDVIGPLMEVIKQRIKPQKVEIDGRLKVTSYESDGVEKIKEFLKEIKDENIDISYLGAGTYSFKIKDDDYKSAEKKIKDISSKEPENLNFAFERVER